MPLLNAKSRTWLRCANGPPRFRVSSVVQPIPSAEPCSCQLCGSRAGTSPALVSAQALTTTGVRLSSSQTTSASRVSTHHLVSIRPSTEREMSSLADTLSSPPWPLGDDRQGCTDALAKTTPSSAISDSWKCGVAVSCVNASR
ncbi:hypothetical protein FQZ97_885940 [compost metagenome]